MKHIWVPNGDNIKELCQGVVDYILDCPLEELKNLTIAELTKKFQVSKMYLIRCFRTHMKTTPGKFIFHEKMERANSLILKNHISVKEISDRLGFCSADYFSKAFRRHYGMPPLQYRSHRAKQDQDYQLNPRIEKPLKARKKKFNN